MFSGPAIRRFFLAAVVCTLVLGGRSVPGAHATTDTVVSTCDTTTLTNAINAAQADLTGGTVTFNCGAPATFTLPSMLSITGMVTIDGTGQSITLKGDGATNQGLFAVTSTGKLSLTDLTLTQSGGKASGAITNAGTLAIADSTVSNNNAGDISDADPTGSDASGGAIYNSSTGSVTITGSTFTDNSVRTNLHVGRGGAIFNAGSLTVTGSAIDGSTVTGHANPNVYGGALYNTGTAEFDDSTIDNSDSYGPGGAVFNTNVLTLKGSSITNSLARDYDDATPAAGRDGGAIDNNGGAVVVESSATQASALNGNAAVNSMGGAIYNHNSASVTITDATLSNNSALSGGAIESDASSTLSVTGTTFDTDESIFQSPASRVLNGGAIETAGLTTIDSSTFTHDAGAQGGAIASAGLDPSGLTVTNSDFENDAAEDVDEPEGGAIYSTGDASISGSVIANNEAASSATTHGVAIGGAIFSGSAGTLTLTNDTLAGNISDGSAAAVFSSGGLVASFDTIAHNGTVPALAGDQGGGILADGPTYLTADILADNFAPAGTNCSSLDTVHDGGYNISDTGTSSDPNCFSAGTDLLSTDPGLFSTGSSDIGLRDNGGPTETIALQDTSPAIDQVPAPCLDALGNAVDVDQRGVTRPVGGTCDIGAYEASIHTTLVLSPSSPDGTNGWYITSPVTATLSTGDPAATTYYAIDDISCAPASLGDCSTYSSAVDVTDGSHTFTYFSIDSASNAGPVTTKTIKVDSAPPDITVPANIVQQSATSPVSVSFVTSVNDNVDPSPTFGCDHNSGDDFPYGTTKVTCNATDAAGNQSQKSFTISIHDTTVPSTSATVSVGTVISTPTPPSFTFTGDDVTVALSVSDPDDAPADLTTYYTTGATCSPSNLTDCTPYTGPFVLTTTSSATYQLSYFSVDASGNVEPIHGPYTILIFKTLPSTTYSLNPSSPDGAGGWYVTRPQMTLAAGGSGTLTTYYSIDDAACAGSSSIASDCTQYNGPFPIPDGAHKVYFFTTSGSNTEAQQEVDVNVDTSPPTTTATGVSGGTAYTFGTTVSGTVTVTLTPDDGSGSGTTHTYFFPGLSTCHNYPQQSDIDANCIDYALTGPFDVSGTGATVIYFFSVDAAGNAESQRSVEVDIGPTASAVKGLSVRMAGGVTHLRWHTATRVLGFNVFDGTTKVNRRLIVSRSGRYTFTTSHRFRSPPRVAPVSASG